jgi:hypothetical protein
MMRQFHYDLISMTGLESLCPVLSESYMSNPVITSLEGSSELVSLVESINS